MALFKNRQWEVTDWGLECRKPEAPYEIEAKRLLETTERSDGEFYDWPVHMAIKTWVDVELFIEAFREALKTHEGKYGGTVDPEMLTASCDYARKEARQISRRA